MFIKVMMKRIIVLGLLISCFVCGVNAQFPSTKIKRIEIDGKEVRGIYKVFFFFSNSNWIEAERTPTGFVIPGGLKNEEYLSVLITFGKYKLQFLEIHISKFGEDWVVGVDKRPYSDEYVRSRDVKTIKRVYYIKFSGQGLGTQLVVMENKTK